MKLKINFLVLLIIGLNSSISGAEESQINNPFNPPEKNQPSNTVGTGTRGSKCDDFTIENINDNQIKITLNKNETPLDSAVLIIRNKDYSNYESRNLDDLNQNEPKIINLDTNKLSQTNSNIFYLKTKCNGTTYLSNWRVINLTNNN